MNHFYRNIIYFVTVFSSAALKINAFNEFPRPTGPYPVGNVGYIWIDETCKEINSETEVTRQFNIKIWYPAQGNPNLFFKQATKKYPFKNQTFIQKFIFKNFCTYAVSNLPLAAYETNKFPVVLFSHGIREQNTSNTAQCENLASHGYIVVGVDHPSSNKTVKLPDGKIIKSTVTKNTVDWDSEEIIWIQDVKFVLNKLNDLNIKEQDHKFYKKIDYEKIGIFGFSFGGSIATRMTTDSRIKAAINLDGGVYSKNAPTGVNSPFMFITGKAYSQAKEKNWSEKHIIDLKFFLDKYKKDSYLVIIEGACHESFSDRALIRDSSFLLRWYDFFMRDKTIDAPKANQIINDLMIAFFDKYLKTQNSSLSDIYKKYTEIIFEKCH